MEINTSERNFSSISPSAKALLMMKGNTKIPFAQEAARIVSMPGTYEPGYDDKSLSDCLRIIHLEARYMSIDQLLNDKPLLNVLELSSGLSFRGLAMVRQKDVHYIDTDLPDVIAEKRKLVEELQSPQERSTLELLPLNALDEVQFTETVNRFEDGPIAIVNEGLLMYLNLEEKKKLCAIIHKVLQRRGGYWITADVYIRLPKMNWKLDDEFEQFLDEHRIEENKFDSLESAELFFKKCGFAIEKEAEIDYAKLEGIPYMMKKASPELLSAMGSGRKINATWRLRVA